MIKALGINTVSSITLKNQSGNEAFKENIISSSVGSALGYRGFYQNLCQVVLIQY